MDVLEKHCLNLPVSFHYLPYEKCKKIVIKFYYKHKTRSVYMRLGQFSIFPNSNQTIIFLYSQIHLSMFDTNTSPKQLFLK